MDTEAKVFENRMRRKLARMGYQLMKSRRRDPDAKDFGGYLITDGTTHKIVAGGNPLAFCLSLKDVETWIGKNGKGK